MRDVSQVNRAMEQYGDMVRRICFLYLKNHSDAQDVFQEVFLKYMLWDKPLDGEEHEKAWLARVAINKCKDSLKSFFRSRVSSLEDADQADLALPQAYSEVYDAVLSLPKHYKSAVYLHYYEGYSAVEIAGILDKKVNTIYTWLARAREMLRERLGGEAFEA